MHAPDPGVFKIYAYPELVPEHYTPLLPPKKIFHSKKFLYVLDTYRNFFGKKEEEEDSVSL